MDKLILANGTQIELQDGSALGNIIVVFPDKEALVTTWDEMTSDNLKSVTITDANDSVIAEYSDLVLVSVESAEKEDGSISTSFLLREKTEVELLKEELAAQKEQSDMLVGCVLEMSEIVYGG